MNKVTFKKGNTSYDSYSDLSLILNSKEISAPSPKTQTVDIVGGDGVLDFTEYFGEVKYNNRTIKMNFTSVIQSDFLTHFSTLQNMLHGQEFKITFSDDPNFYYVGRIFLDAWKVDKRICSFGATVDCQPYKYKQNVTTVTNTISTNTTLTYSNLHKKVVPKITVSNGVVLLWGTSTYTIDAGTYTLPSILFSKGNNSIEFRPTERTTIKVEYQEGEL